MVRKKRNRCAAGILAGCMLLSQTVFAAAETAAETVDAEAVDAETVDVETDNTTIKIEMDLFEPWVHGYRFVDVLNFDPESDLYAKQLRAEVELQERIEPFLQTQAKQVLTVPSRLYAISAGNYRSTDVNEAPWNGAMAYPEFSYNLFKFWQYTDMIGAGGRPTEGIAPGAQEKEYGTVAIPIPAYINAAHKNGVMVLGEYFVPRTPQYTGEWIKAEDGSYPYAQKLLEMKEYYGFDGYFINQEEAITQEEAALLREMIQWMREQGCYVQWYDSILENGSISYQNALNQNNCGWLWKDEAGQGANSIFLNYWYDKDALKESAALAKELGLDPYETVYMGVEGGQWKFDYHLGEDYGLADPDGNPYTSIAIWGSDFYHEQYNKPKNRYEVGYQWEAEERERLYFSGPTENVAKTSENASVSRSDIGVDTVVFEGMAEYLAENSVISGSVFASDFNTGHGMQYWHQGECISQEEWSNVNLQAILPTWQWRIESEDTYCMDLDWDYGPAYYRLDAEGAEVPFAYEQKGAWTGGSSLAVYGALQQPQQVFLYKTSLDVTAESSLELVYWQPEACAGQGQVKVMLVLEDAPEKPETIALDIVTEAGEDWKKGTVSLAAYAGRRIAAIGLEFSSEEYLPDYQFNLGSLMVTDGQDHTPAAPEKLELAYAFAGNGAVEVTWEPAAYEEVPLYRLYARYADGTRGFLGGAYSSLYDVMYMERSEEITALELCAVGIDGSESEPAVLEWDADPLYTDIQAEVTGDTLSICWNQPEEKGDGLTAVRVEGWYQEAEKCLVYETVTEENQVAIPAVEMDGSQILVTLKTAEAGETEQQNALFTLPDRICEAYDGELRIDQSNGSFSLTTPSQEDWYTAYVTIQGKTEQYQRFGGKALTGLRFSRNGLGAVGVVIADMDGNRSEPVSFFVENGVLLDPESEYTKEMIPDDVLREKLQQIVGPKLADLGLYEGVLDLSVSAESEETSRIQDLTGIELLERVEEINLSGSGIEKIRSTMFSEGVKRLVLENCEALKKIDLEKRPDIQVELAGCSGLETLEMNGTKQKILDLRDAVGLQDCEIAGSEIQQLLLAEAASYTEAKNWDWQGARLTLTPETAEGQFAAAFAAQFEASGLAPVGLEKGFFYGNQRPPIAKDWETPLELKADGAEHQLLTVLEARMAAYSLEAEGILLTELEDTAWIDSAYLKECTEVPTQVKVSVREESQAEEETAAEDGVSAFLSEQPAAVKTVVEQGAFEGEEGKYLTDGDPSTKWCYGKESGYAVLELEEPIVMGAWKTIHAGSEAAGYISRSFRIQVLNPEIVSDDEYLSTTHSGKQSLLRNPNAWVDLDAVTENAENEVMRILSPEQLTTAQVYRFQVDQAEQGAGGAVRVYEIALYPYEGELGEDRNGLFCADTPGTYQVSYTQNGEIIAQLKLVVTQ